jgi:hypothetical protein
MDAGKLKLANTVFARVSAQSKADEFGGAKKGLSIPGIKDLMFHVPVIGADGKVTEILSKRTAAAPENTTTCLSGKWKPNESVGVIDSDCRSPHLSLNDFVPRPAVAATGSVLLQIGCVGHAVASLINSDCPICELQIAADWSYGVLRAHVCSHWKGKSVRTECCGSVFFLKKRSFVDHVLEKHLGLSWSCRDCSAGCESLEQADAHCRMVRFKKDAGSACPYCAKLYAIEAKLDVHIAKCQKRTEEGMRRNANVLSRVRALFASKPGFSFVAPIVGSLVPAQVPGES